MTAPTTPRPAASAANRTATRRSAPDTDRREARRSRANPPLRLSRAGRPVRSALLRVPFVVALIVVLSVGVGLVLYLNTSIDESGMRTEEAKSTSAQLRLQIEALERDIADLNSTPRIAERARALGLVPVGDAAMVIIDDDGRATVVGEPSPVKGAPQGGR